MGADQLKKAGDITSSARLIRCALLMALLKHCGGQNGQTAGRL